MTRSRGAAKRWFASLFGLAILAVVGIAVVRLAFDHENPPSETVASARSSEARDSLCAAAADARRGDVGSAMTTFLGRTHDQLHMLAGDAAKRSRAVSARLLEAKAKVEGDFSRSSTATVVDDLEALAVATGQAMAAVGGVDPGPCRR